MQSDRLVFENQQYFGQIVVLSDRPLVIGRANDAGLVINHESVSRKHARITREAAGYRVEDLGSSNGTFVNEVRLTQPTLLANGDRLRLGPEIALRLELTSQVVANDARLPEAGLTRPTQSPGRVDQSVTDAGQAASTAPLSRTPAHLTITTAEGETTEHDLVADEITLGRMNENDLVVKASIVSRRQFSFRRQGKDYQLVLRPTAVNPVFVNNDQVRDQRLLKDGDVLCIGYVGGAGAVMLHYHAAQVATAAAPDTRPAPAASPAAADATVVQSGRSRAAGSVPSPAGQPPAAAVVPAVVSAVPLSPPSPPSPVPVVVPAQTDKPVAAPAPAAKAPSGESHPLFRQRALDRLNSPEQLNELLAVTSPLGWLSLLTVSAILVAGLLWGLLGSVRLEVTGQGILAPGANAPLEAVLFLTPADAQQVRPGMAVQIAPVTVSKNQFGMLLGTVTTVSQAPATEAEMLAALGTDSLVANRVAAGAVMAVRVQLAPDSRTASGYAWTSVNGPPVTLTSATLCAGIVTVAEQRPIALVWGGN